MSDGVLASWNEGKAKDAIVDFVEAGDQAGPDFVALADRIATFDNDGTLWVEQPLPPQFDFVFGKWAEEIKQDPSLAEQQPYKAIIDRDPAFFVGVATQDPDVVATLLKAFARSWAGHHPGGVRCPGTGVAEDGQAAQARDALCRSGVQADARADRLAEGATTSGCSCVSGGGRDFMRVFAEETWGIYKENVIGTAADYSYTDGKIVRAEHALGSLNVGPGKPEHIFAQTGRLPAFAGGNADVDIEMLSAARFAVLVNHDDGSASSLTPAAAEKSLAKAKELGWTVISMKDDWSTVF